MTRVFLSIASFFGPIAMLLAGGMIRILDAHPLIYIGMVVLLIWICISQVAIEYLKWKKGIH